MQKQKDAGGIFDRIAAHKTSNFIVVLPLGSEREFTNQAQNRKAERLYLAALQWRVNNPDIWEYWLARAQAYASCHAWFSMQALIEDARREGHINKGGSEFAVHQDYKTAFIRMICAEVPNAINCVSLRSSIFEKAYKERMEGGVQGELWELE